MRGRLIRFVLKASVVAALGWAARRALIRWVDGPAQEPSRAPWGPIAATPAEEIPAAAATESPPAEPETMAVATEPAAPAAKAAKTTTKAAKTTAKATKTAAPKAAKRAAPKGAEPQGWVVPDAAGACPATHPVKARLDSQLFSLPGMAAYDRITPDRCYPSGEAAEQDGFTKAMQ